LIGNTYTMQQTTWYKKILSVTIIFSLLLVFTPKPANSFILLSALFQGLLAQYTITSLVVDTLITCVLASCGGGGSGNGGTCDVGGPCTIPLCGESIPGSILEGESGECGCTPDDPTVDINEDECEIYPLGAPPLSITPPIVRVGDTATVTWDIGVNDATRCLVSGPHIDTLTLSDTSMLDGVGSATITVTGPHVYNLVCQQGDQQESAAEQVRIAGESTEF